MTQTKHTPGPWTVGKFEDTGLINQISVHPSICTAYGNKDEAEANARLIAAAPELLEALEALLPRLEEICDEQGDALEHSGNGTAENVSAHAILFNQILHARAAITKATGGEA